MARRPRRRNQTTGQDTGGGVATLDPMGMPMPPPPSSNSNSGYGPSRKKRPPKLSEDEATKLVNAARSFWSARDERFRDDEQVARGIWEQPDSPNRLVADESIVSDHTIPGHLNKFIARLSAAKLQRSLEPTRPEHTPVVQDGEDAWRSAAALIERRHSRRSLMPFRREESHYACLRGWVCRRVTWNPQSALDGDFAVDCELVDPATVYPVYGPDGLEFVVHTVRQSKHELMVAFPELDILDFKQVRDAGHFDQIDITVLWSKWDAYYFIDGEFLRTVPHDYEWCPWILFPIRGVVTVGMAASPLQGLAWGSSYAWSASTGADSTSSADIGVSCFHELVGTTRAKIKAKSLIARIVELKATPPKKLIGPQTVGIDAQLDPDRNVHLSVGQDMEPIVWDTGMPFLQLYLQAITDDENKNSLPAAAWGDSEGVTSGLHQSYVSATLDDALIPYRDALALSEELTWQCIVDLYARWGRTCAPFQFMAKRGGTAELCTLGPDEFNALKDAIADVTFRGYLPGERASNVALAHQLFQIGKLSTLTGLGDEFVGLDDPRGEDERIEAEKARQHPMIQMLYAYRSLQKTDPEMFAWGHGFLEQSIMQMYQQMMAPPQPPGQPQSGPGPGQPPGPATPGGQLQPPLPSLPMGPPMIGGQAGPGGPIGPPAPMPGMPGMGMSAPQPYNVPGLQALMAGMPAIPGGVQSGLPTSVLPPGMLGQSIAPGAEPPEMAIARQIAALMASGAMPTR